MRGSLTPFHTLPQQHLWCCLVSFANSFQSPPWLDPPFPHPASIPEEGYQLLCHWSNGGRDLWLQNLETFAALFCGEGSHSKLCSGHFSGNKQNLHGLLLKMSTSSGIYQRPCTSSGSFIQSLWFHHTLAYFRCPSVTTKVKVVGEISKILHLSVLWNYRAFNPWKHFRQSLWLHIIMWIS